MCKLEFFHRRVESFLGRFRKLSRLLYLAKDFRRPGIEVLSKLFLDFSHFRDRNVDEKGVPIVVKADGLCGGKGAIMCPTNVKYPIL